MEHSQFSPSSMSIAVNCDAHWGMTASIVNEETEEQREGTAAHWVGQKLLEDHVLGDEKVIVGCAAPNGVIVTDEMYDAALVYYNEVSSIAKNHAGLVLEDTVSIKSIHPDCFGTPDATLWIPDKKTLHVWDFKYGHKLVSAYQNYQLGAYAIGVLENIYGIDHCMAENACDVVLHVVQPRCFHNPNDEPDVWHIKNHELRGMLNQMIAACALHLQDGDRIARSGPHCYGCSAKIICPTLQNNVMSIIDYASTGIPKDLTDVGLGYELNLLEKMKDIISFRKDALEQDVYNRLKHGKIVPGFTLKDRFKNSSWKIPDEQIIEMGKSIYDCDFSAGVKAITPAQAKVKLKRNNLPDTAIDGLYGMEPAGKRVVKDDGSKAKQIFSTRGLDK